MTDYSSLSSAGLTSADEEEDGSKEQNQPPAAAQVKQRKKGSSKSGTRRERVVGKFGRSYKRAESYVQYGSPKMFMKKSDSERALVAQDRRDSSTSTSTTSSATRVNSAQPRPPAVATSVKKSGDRRRFKRSLTMNSIPVIVSEKVDSNMIRVPPPRPSEGGDGDGTEGSATKFTIGTSDEDDLDDDDDDDESDDETMP